LHSRRIVIRGFYDDLGAVASAGKGGRLGTFFPAVFLAQ